MHSASPIERMRVLIRDCFTAELLARCAQPRRHQLTRMLSKANTPAGIGRTSASQAVGTRAWELVIALTIILHETDPVIVSGSEAAPSSAENPLAPASGIESAVNDAARMLLDQLRSGTEPSSPPSLSVVDAAVATVQRTLPRKVPEAIPRAAERSAETIRRFEHLVGEVAARALLSDSPAVRSMAAGCLARAAETSAHLPILIDALDGTDPGIRPNVILALGNAGPAALPCLEQILARGTPARHEYAVILAALGRLGTAATPALPAILRALQVEDASVLRRAIVAAGRIGPAAAAAIPDLLRLAADPFAGCGREATIALAAIGAPPEAAPFLIAHLDDLPATESGRLHAALKSLGAAAIPALAAALHSHARRHSHRDIIRLLGDLGEPGVPTLIDAIVHQHLQADIIGMLDQIQPGVAQNAVALLTKTDEMVVQRLRTLSSGGGSPEPDPAPFVDVSRGPTDALVLQHLTRLTRSASELSRLRTFWCVGRIDREAMRSRSQGLSFRRLKVELERWRDWSKVLDMGISENHIRACLAELEGMFDRPPLTDGVWGPHERDVEFRVPVGRNRRNDFRWGPRAYRAWCWVDVFLAARRLRPCAGGDPGPAAAIDGPPEAGP